MHFHIDRSGVCDLNENRYIYDVVGQFVWDDTPDKLVSSLRLEMPAKRLCLNLPEAEPPSNAFPGERQGTRNLGGVCETTFIAQSATPNLGTLGC
jgi:hypothetical protein